MDLEIITLAFSKVQTRYRYCQAYVSCRADLGVDKGKTPVTGFYQTIQVNPG
jgi:hypothetical protein